MADCSKAIEFSRELYRLCEMETEEDLPSRCSDTCPFNKNGRHTCPFGRTTTQEDIDIVQKWSDEHPIPKPKTYADDLFEKFPKVRRIGERPTICRAKLYGTTCKVIDDGGVTCLSVDDCTKCWNEVMPE